jgi:uncharacterized protein
MDRRNALASAFAALAGAFTAPTLSSAGAEGSGSDRAVPKAVYHLSDIDKVAFVLGNMRNHIEGMGGADRVRLALVVHGPPLKAFRADTTNATLKSDLAGIKSAGAEFYACIHTMEGMKLTLADLLPGFAVADKGGVVKLAELQGQGYAYLRP